MKTKKERHPMWGSPVLKKNPRVLDTVADIVIRKHGITDRDWIKHVLESKSKFKWDQQGAYVALGSEVIPVTWGEIGRYK